MDRIVKILNFNVEDSHGDTFLPGSLKNCEVWLTKDFNFSTPISKVNVTVDDDAAYIDVNTDHLNGLYPSIAFQPVNVNRIGKKRALKDIKLFGVSVGPNPNIDNTIEPI